MSPEGPVIKVKLGLLITLTLSLITQALLIGIYKANLERDIADNTKKIREETNRLGNRCDKIESLIDRLHDR